MGSGESYAETFKELPLSPLILVFCSLVLLILSALVFYHYYLGSTLQTTYEHYSGTFSSYFQKPYSTGSAFTNLKQRIFIRKNPRPFFEPMEVHEPDRQNFKAPELKTPQSLIDQSHSMISNSCLTQNDYPDYASDHYQHQPQRNKVNLSGIGALG